MGQINYAAASSLPMSDIADWYLIHFMNIVGVSKVRKATTPEIKNQPMPANPDLALNTVKL